mgnify:CR=1 FL=1|jgi:hypothetical protein
MTTPKMTLKNDNPKETKVKTPEYPEWPGRDKAEIGVKYINKKGNIIQLGSSK